MTTRQSAASIFARAAALALIAAALTGCFRSDTALIGADEADFPFHTITYVRAGEADKITLERSGDRYINPEEPDKGSLRLKALSDNLFVAELSDVEDGEAFYLYGYIELAADMTGFELIKGVARPDDLAAAKKGKNGMTICPEDAKMVCIAALEGFVEHAATTARAEFTKHFNILAME